MKLCYESIDSLDLQFPDLLPCWANDLNNDVVVDVVRPSSWNIDKNGVTPKMVNYICEK